MKNGIAAPPAMAAMLPKAISILSVESENLKRAMKETGLIDSSFSG